MKSKSHCSRAEKAFYSSCQLKSLDTSKETRKNINIMNIGLSKLQQNKELEYQKSLDPSRAQLLDGKQKSEPNSVLKTENRAGVGVFAQIIVMIFIPSVIAGILFSSYRLSAQAEPGNLS